jgi:hypothetical protein
LNAAAATAGAKAILPILAGAVALTVAAVLTLTLMVTGDANAVANAQTCSSALQAAPDPGAAPNPADAVIVPIRPAGPQNQPRWSPEQIRNAATITNTGRSLRLPPRAAVIAVATAMQESSLQNLKAGDRDSLGLFQQRPSQGWGSISDIEDPVKASEAFYRVLTTVPNWQTIPLAQAAQTVQRSAYPQAYAPWEQSAGALVAETWGTTAVTSLFSGCTSTGAADPTADFRLTHPNPRTPAQAIAAARWAAAGNWRPARYGLCDNFTAQAYGWGSSGSDTAAIHWSRLVSLGEAHPGDANPPAGALLFYTDHNPAGHVDIYLGHDQVASTDVAAPDTVAVVSRAAILNWLGPHSYLGWANPDFPNAGPGSTLPVPGSPA